MIQKNPTQDIGHLDKNDFCCYAMTKSLPKGRFKLFHLVKFNLDKYDDNSFRCCVLEIEFEYPKELQELHNNNPLAPDNIKKEINIKKEMVT